MKYLETYFMAFILLVFSSGVLAENYDFDQKMIIINGDESRLMKGDPYIHSHNKALNYNKNRVLPFFLNMGWRIQSVHMNDKSKKDNQYGYVIIERPRKKN